MKKMSIIGNTMISEPKEEQRKLGTGSEHCEDRKEATEGDTQVASLLY